MEKHNFGGVTPTIIPVCTPLDMTYNMSDLIIN